MSKNEMVNTSVAVGVSENPYAPNHRTVSNVVVAPNVKVSAEKNPLLGSLWNALMRSGLPLSKTVVCAVAGAVRVRAKSAAKAARRASE
ncbi:MAG: hypothetical protein H8F28_08275 [Fibrella sp.]|nr:hypothetical protein [Armatimonadota bacterium]